MENELTIGYGTGTEMWRDHAESYGVITALVMCHRYLELHTHTTDESERVFCDELREAMGLARNYRDVTVYRHSERYAEQNGEVELCDQSDTVNRMCARDIDDAIRACEFGDGTHNYKAALAALSGQYGTERLNIVLASEISWLGFAGQIPDGTYQWARGFNLGGLFYGGFHLRTRPDVLCELIHYMRNTAEITHTEITINTEENMSDKTIRFIDSGYRELFCIPDGGSIRITYPPGDGREPITRACKYLDEMHFQTLGRGGDVYHCCQFAEIMERLGAKYEPEFQLRGAELIPHSHGEDKYFTYNHEEGNTCVGHISGDFGGSGERYSGNWSDRKNDRNTLAFQTELHSAVYTLRQDLLKDYNGAAAYCESHPEALIDSGDNYKRYGFKLETDTRQYYTQCFFGENMRAARFTIYAYDKTAARVQERQAGEKPSVLEQIRAAEKAPKPPRKQTKVRKHEPGL